MNLKKEYLDRQQSNQYGLAGKRIASAHVTKDAKFRYGGANSRSKTRDYVGSVVKFSTAS